ncbi:MAG: hypothetical protein RIQ54_215, partial [Candidatus Parcubacteria bacterium]
MRGDLSTHDVPFASFHCTIIAIYSRYDILCCMDSLIKADVFFFITSVAVFLVTVGLL